MNTMQLKYGLTYRDCCYLIKRDNIPYYDFSNYSLPDGCKGKRLFGLSFYLWMIPMKIEIENELTGIKIH